MHATASTPGATAPTPEPSGLAPKRVPSPATLAIWEANEHGDSHRRVRRSGVWHTGVALCLLLSLSMTGVALASGPGTWRPTGSMRAARTGNIAVPLGNGQVLVAAGEGAQGQFLASAELFNPEAGAWSPTGSLPLAPYSPSATVLANGQVLVVGGEVQIPAGGGFVFLSSARAAEIYDPRTGSWHATSPPRSGRAGHTATLLPDGRVLVVGGFCLLDASVCPSGPLVPGEVYDPTADTWTEAATPAGIETATLLADGRVLLVGAGAAALYDPDTGTVRATGQPRQARSSYTATLLPDGEVLVVGGQVNPACEFCGPLSVDSAELYDPGSGTWRPAGHMAVARQAHAATLLPDGLVLVTGGVTLPADIEAPEVTLDTAELFDPRTGAWTSAGSMSTPRSGHSATVLPSGLVLVAGGFTASAELYTPPDSTVLPTRCDLTLTGTDPQGHVFIRIGVRDVGSGLESIGVVEATNASVVLPRFAPATRDPAVATARKMTAPQASMVSLRVTNRAGKTVICDPVISELADQHDGTVRHVFANLPQAESKLQLTNGVPGLTRVRVQVNNQRLRLDNLRDGEVRTLDVANAMRPGDDNTIAVTTHGRRGSSALLVISD